MNAIDRKPITDMTTDEKLNEILESLRMFQDALEMFRDHPMTKMLPGLKMFGRG